ncbi:MAG TPA: malto-oligosyltrehalose synthase, partial [Verrucomicrobiae bacterium]|nr:malto-oligosyltrehalose synthase [Verrucomicrobiae bacterium]
RDFTFDQADQLVEYWRDLGISDLYASPLFLAGPESTHGYDICDFNQINPNLGSEEEFQRFTTHATKAGLGLLLDMVPNHMGACASNAWWQEVLRDGPESRFAHYFDVDWNARPDRKILLPVLGDRYGEVLARGEIKLIHEANEWRLGYFDKRFPISKESDKKLRSDSAQQILSDYNSDRAKLHSLIQEQHYRLAFWRVGAHEINYRRFFDVTGLISLRVEDEEVFSAAHQYVFALLKKGCITGLRIDHPDGLRDPATYFSHLQAGFKSVGGTGKLFVVAEKILSDTERLPPDWEVFGTTGYDFLIYLNGLFVAAPNEARLTQIYHDFAGCSKSYEEIAREAKKEVLAQLFPKEVRSLTAQLRRIADQTIAGVDFTTDELQGALVEFIAAFSIYRTYVRAGMQRLRPEEERSVRAAVQGAQAQRPDLQPALEFLQRVLCLELKDTESAEDERLEFIARFQQLSGPATAKGLEDTAFYRYNRFLSLNEVGGNPGHFGASPAEFHEYNQRQQQQWPHSLLATATHDTKRGEDLRARLNVLSELPEEWGDHLARWRELNCGFKSEFESRLEPSANDEFLLYQTLLGSWVEGEPIQGYIERIQEYLLKATREAKVHTSWTEPNDRCEKATAQFVASILRSQPFLDSFIPWQKKIAFFGVFNSLSQLVLKVCSPGVPDFYQGTELWDFSLVDPDNRRPVNYTARQELLQRVKTRSADSNRSGYLGDLIEQPACGEIKMFATWNALQFRHRHRSLLEQGEYFPLQGRGGREDHLVSFARTLGDKSIAVVAPRWPATLANGAMTPPIGRTLWRETKIDLPIGKNWREVFAGKTFSREAGVGELLADFPVALLESIA